MNDEIWKDILIDNEKSDYQISNLGRVKRIGKYVYWRNTPDPNKISKRFLKEHILSPINCGSEGLAYKAVIIYNKNYKVHRLVATYFLDNPNNYNIVNHKNAIKFDNRAENLEWVTYSQNSIHAHINNLMNKAIGHRNSKTTVTNEQVLLIKEHLSGNLSMSEISKLVGVSYNIVYNVKNGIAWTWLTGFKNKQIPRHKDVYK